MKKLIYTGLLAVAFLASCGEASKKGAWSDADKALMEAEVKKVEGDLDAFGDKKQDFIDCYTEKVEAGYDNFAEANKDVEGCKTLAMDCAGSVM
jgi:hypothetical protein